MGRGSCPSPLLCSSNSVVARTHQDAVRHAGDGDQSVGLVANLHGVDGRAAAEVNGGRGRSDNSLASCTDMGGVEFSPDGVGLLARVSFTRVNLCCKRRRSLREGSGCATVEDSGALAVSVDGHGDHGA